MRINGKEGVKYTLDDISIKPYEVTDVKDVNECNPNDNFGKLPIFTNPSKMVVNDVNYKTYLDNNIKPIIPITVDIDRRLEILKEEVWVAFSVDEFEKHFTSDEHLEVPTNTKYYVLIDSDTGNANAMYETVLKANEIYHDRICTMVNNITNPQTYRKVFESDINFVCITDTIGDSGIKYPIVSLLDEVIGVRDEIRSTGVCGCRLPKIVVKADVQSQSDIIKLLAVGADHVMVDTLLVKTLESAAPKSIDWQDGENGGTFSEIYKKNGIWYGVYSEEFVNETNDKITDDTQKLKVEEVAIGTITAKVGDTKPIEVDYTVGQWAERLKDNIRLVLKACNGHSIFDLNHNTPLLLLK